MVKDFGDVLTMPWGSSISSSSHRESFGKEIGLGDLHCSRLKMKLGVAFSSISDEVDGMDEMQQLADIILWQGLSVLLLFFLSSSLLPSSPLFLSFSSLLWWPT